MSSSPDAPVAPDHLARQLSARFMSLLLPVTLVMGVVVWSTANLSPIYAAIVDDDTGDTTSTSSEDASTTDKLLSSAVEAVMLVVMVLLTTLVVLLLYYCRCSAVLYGWFMFSSVSIFFVMAWVWLDLVLTRFQIPYSTVSMGIVLWNLAVTGTASMFFYAHPLFTQASLLFASVLVAWSLTALPTWTGWAVLLAIAAYDMAAVLCPGGPLRVLIRLSRERGDPIPGFVYDTDQEVRALAPANAPLEAPTTTNGSHTHATTMTTCERPQQREGRRAREEDEDEEPTTSTAVPVVATGAREAPSAAAMTPPVAPASPSSGALPPTVGPPRASFESLSPAQRMLLLSRAPFKLGLGDFIFYSMLVGEAYRAGSLIAWSAPFLVVLSGMVLTLVSLLFRSGQGALPALPVSIFAATLMFLLCCASLTAFVEGAASLNLVL